MAYNPNKKTTCVAVAQGLTHAQAIGLLTKDEKGWREGIEDFVGGFKLLPSFDETAIVPEDIYPSKTDEDGNTIEKNFDEVFLIFETDEGRYLYALDKSNNGKNYDCISTERLNALSDYIGVNSVLTQSEFNEQYSIWKNSQAPTLDEGEIK